MKKPLRTTNGGKAPLFPNHTIPCPRCKGTGRIPDPNGIGAELKAKRIALGLSVREVARRMKFTASYISDLENGRRHWKETTVQRYHEALKSPSA